MGEAAEIRREIDQTRDDMTETVDALGYKMDVPARTKEAVQERAESVKETVTEGGRQVVGRAKQQGSRAQSFVERNALAISFGALAGGFVIGMLIPTSRVEEEKLGPVASDLTDKAREKGGEAIKRVGEQAAERVSEQVQETAQRVSDSAAQAVRQQSEDLGQRVEESGS
jgi:ElaB/YqjD/DUF883 family membrane-anchored ribosome-binding protein